MGNISIKSVFIAMMTTLWKKGLVAPALYKEFMESINSMQTRDTANPPQDTSEFDSTMSSENVAFHTILAMGRKKANKTKGIARAMSLVKGGVNAMAQYLVFMNEDNEFLGASAKVTIGNPGQTEVNTQEVNLGTTEGVNTLYLVHMLNTNPNLDYAGGQYWTMDEFVDDPAITAPVQANNNVNYSSIVIGLGRGTRWLGVHGDADYTYARQRPGDTVVPFSGSAQFGSNILDITRASNLRPRLFLSNIHGHIMPWRPRLGKKWTDYISANGDTLTWNWPQNDPAAFGLIPSRMVDVPYYLHFEVGVKTANSDGEFIYVQVHSMDKDIVPNNMRLTNVGWGKEDQVDDGIAYIYSIEFAWHCVGEGTEVILKDGSTKLIEDIIGNDEIRIDAEGNTMEVRSTIEQWAAHDDVVYELRDDADNAMIITGDHWVPTDGGNYKRVEDLKPGDGLQTVNGPTKVAVIKPAHFTGRLLSLSLGSHEQRPNIGVEGTTFAANNILVADNQLCRRNTILQILSAEQRMAGLPHKWQAIIEEQAILSEDEA